MYNSNELNGYTKHAALALALLLPAAALSAQTFRGTYQCTGGRKLSVTALLEINFIDNYHVELILSGVQRPIYYSTTYKTAGDEMYIQHDRNAVFTFKIQGETLVGVSHPYEDRKCVKQGPAP